MENDKGVTIIVSVGVSMIILLTLIMIVGMFQEECVVCEACVEPTEKNEYKSYAEQQPTSPVNISGCYYTGTNKVCKGDMWCYNNGQIYGEPTEKNIGNINPFEEKEENKITLDNCMKIVDIRRKYYQYKRFSDDGSLSEANFSDRFGSLWESNYYFKLSKNKLKEMKEVKHEK